MSCVYCDPKSRMRIFSAWMSGNLASVRRRSVVARRALHNERGGRLSRGQADRFVVERAAAAPGGGAGLGEHVGVALLAQVAALGEERHVAALLRIVAHLNGQTSQGALALRKATVGDAARRVGVHGDDYGSCGLPLGPLRVLRLLRRDGGQVEGELRRY